MLLLPLPLLLLFWAVGVSPAERRTCHQLQLTSVHSTVHIQTPGYPGPYPSNHRDCWVISTDTVTPTSDEQHVIKLTTIVMETEYDGHNHGCVDFIEVFDGSEPNTNTSFGKWCRYASKPIVSSGSKLYVNFYSNGWNTFRGFFGIASVSVLAGRGPRWERFLPCQALYIATTNITYSLASPGSPIQYSNNIDMCWVIYMEGRLSKTMSHFIKVDFEDVETERDLYCAYDFVHLRDGSHTCGDIIGEVCGIEIPGPLISCKPTMNIRFRTDGSSTYGGWSFTYQAVPSITHTCFLAYFDAGVIFGYCAGALLLLIIIGSTITASRCNCREPIELPKLGRKISIISVTPVPGPSSVRRPEDVIPNFARSLSETSMKTQDKRLSRDFDIDKHLEDLDYLHRQLTLRQNSSAGLPEDA